MRKMRYAVLFAAAIMMMASVQPAVSAEEAALETEADETAEDAAAVAVTADDEAATEAAADAETAGDAADEEAQTAQGGTDGKVASADEMITPEDVVEDWMVPIAAEELNDGVYEIEVESSSSMFSITKCELTVADGQMTAVMTMGGKGYLYLYMGTGGEAASASEEDYIPFVENEAGEHTFEVPVEALDQGLDCAAFSKNKEKWYDRVIVFNSKSLDTAAFKELRVTTAQDLGLEDGTYTAEAKLEGGSGRASIESPAQFTVENGEITAQIVFGSANYDYMLVDGEKYELVNTEGNSTFLIPLVGFDYAVPVVADTIAMSVPHEIDYLITFDSATIAKAE